jgi:hypothetical protein
MQAQFVYRLLEPYQQLVTRCARPDLIGPAMNDVINSACALAVSAAHFREALKLAKDTDQVGEPIREKLQDVADTLKHGSLRDPMRTVSFSTAMAYEFNEQGQFRFLRTEITAQNGKYGSFDLVAEIGRYVVHLNAQLGLNFTGIEPNLTLLPFGDWAEAFVTPKTFQVGSMQIKTYRRTASGELMLADAPTLAFVIY